MRDTKREVLAFWFEETSPAQWFQKNAAFDREICERFLMTYEMAADGLCRDWSREPDGALALCIVLDQFPRNMFRNDARAFATDADALCVAREALHKGFDLILSPVKRRFLYLPFEHSEDRADQERSVQLFGAMKADDPVAYEYALRHREVIERFGRFPHRNALLGRESTPEEAEYLRDGGGF